MTLAVPPGVLSAAKAEWDDAADELDGNWRRLHKASTDGFSPEVAAAVEAFREPWVDEIKAAAREAQGHSDDLALFHHQVLLADAEQAERIRALLPWVHRNAEIREW
ncbi:hypothetical protein [Nocardioides sp. SYSU DS0651]|uniref:hypothetical protein n=1 Tax=Nocardioides sp. SYSU DS0651 TaxID=3415955 RepID=UPI003F4C3EC5